MFVGFLTVVALLGCDAAPTSPPLAAGLDAAMSGTDSALADAATACNDAKCDPEPLCDGSTAIRLGYQQGGGGPVPNNDTFMRPFGYTFLVIDGLCHYYLGPLDAREGIRHGELSRAEADQISRDVDFAKLLQWNGQFGQGCPDQGGFNLVTSKSQLSLACGCGGCVGAPPGAEDALNKILEWYAELEPRSSALTGPIRALAESLERVHETTPVYDWPVARAIAETEGLVFVPNYNDPPPPGVLFEGSDATALRMLREEGNADFKRALEDDSSPPSPVARDSDSRGYLLHLRDELPADHAAAIRAFFATRAQAPQADAGL